MDLSCCCRGIRALSLLLISCVCVCWPDRRSQATTCVHAPPPPVCIRRHHLCDMLRHHVYASTITPCAACMVATCVSSAPNVADRAVGRRAARGDTATPGLHQGCTRARPKARSWLVIRQGVLIIHDGDAATWMHSTACELLCVYVLIQYGQLGSVVIGGVP